MNVAPTLVAVLLCSSLFVLGFYLGANIDDGEGDPDGDSRLTENDSGWCDFRVEILYPGGGYEMYCIPDGAVVRVNSSDIP